MNELCKLKHKLDDQMRNPSNSDLSAHVTTLESQLAKKDDKLKKLERENSKL
jgi:predicted nuclease with TOPRIM domain